MRMHRKIQRNKQREDKEEFRPLDNLTFPWRYPRWSSSLSPTTVKIRKAVYQLHKDAKRIESNERLAELVSSLAEDARCKEETLLFYFDISVACKRIDDERYQAAVQEKKEDPTSAYRYQGDRALDKFYDGGQVSNDHMKEYMRVRESAPSYKRMSVKQRLDLIRPEPQQNNKENQ